MVSIVGRVDVARIAYQGPRHRGASPDGRCSEPAVRAVLARGPAPRCRARGLRIVRGGRRDAERDDRRGDRQASGRRAGSSRGAGLRRLLRSARDRHGEDERSARAHLRRQGDTDAARGPASGDAEGRGHHAASSAYAADQGGEASPQAHGAGCGRVYGRPVRPDRAGCRRRSAASTRRRQGAASSPRPRNKSSSAAITRSRTSRTLARIFVTTSRIASVGDSSNRLASCTTSAMRTTIFIRLSYTLFVFDMPGTPFGRRPGHKIIYTTQKSS